MLSHYHHIWLTKLYAAEQHAIALNKKDYASACELAVLWYNCAVAM